MLANHALLRLYVYRCEARALGDSYGSAKQVYLLSSRWLLEVVFTDRFEPDSYLKVCAMNLQALSE